MALLSSQIKVEVEWSREILNEIKSETINDFKLNLGTLLLLDKGESKQGEILNKIKSETINDKH